MNLEFQNWSAALSAFLKTLPAHEGQDWETWNSSNTLLDWNDPQFKGQIPIQMGGQTTSYLERHVTIVWERRILQFSQYDSKTEAGTDSWFVMIPPEWLEAFQKLKWPVADSTPLF